jgi:predicted metalloendopeptidase
MSRRLREAVGLAALMILSSVAAAQGHGIEKGFMNPSVPPCQDFFRYANGAWLDTVSFPAAYTSVGSAREMADRNQEVLHSVLEQAAAHAATEKDPDIRKVGQLYAVLMDTGRAERDGAKPIAKSLDQIDGIKTRADIVSEMGRLAMQNIAAPFRFSRQPDPGQSSMNIANLSQGGLGLPERDFYFRADPKSDSLRQAYVATMKRMFQLVGAPEAQAQSNAEAAMKLETALAESSLTRVQMRDPHALYHKITVKDLAGLAPAIDWKSYYTEVGLPELGQPQVSVNVSMPAFVRRVDGLVQSEPIDEWQAYFKAQVMRRAAPWLSQEWFDADFAFQSKLTGAREPLERWKRAAAAVDFALGEALGKAYVAVAFPPSSKQRMLEMVANLRAALGDRIATLDWMSPATKQMAKQKLDAILPKIGYPDHWRDYSKLAIDPNASAVENLRRAQLFEAQRQRTQIGRAVDRTEWGMTPPTVNAYYNPQVNEIVFPAGILQPGRFDPAADDAANYGAVGAVIGHEISHGFDDQGRQFDATGNLKDWWTEDDAVKFKARAQKVVDQYSSYVAVDSLHVNGKLTLGENIADIAGCTVAYQAWKRSLQGKPAPPTVDGFTPEQRFFIAFAQSWRSKSRPEQIRTRVLSDPHSPAEWRVNGTVWNMPEFQQAFGCKDGDPMVAGAGLRGAIW